MFDEQYGDAVDSSSGKTPLHTLLSSISSHEDLVVQAIDDLCDAHPTCITHVDSNGFIPLHTALSNNMPLKVIVHLIERNGSSVSIAVSENCSNVSLAKMLPFHLAAASRGERGPRRGPGVAADRSDDPRVLRASMVWVAHSRQLREVSFLERHAPRAHRDCAGHHGSGQRAGRGGGCRLVRTRVPLAHAVIGAGFGRRGDGAPRSPQLLRGAGVRAERHGRR